MARTQAGIISIFNILGLLVHEIIMSVPVISIEWVGDMSGPSTLLKRSPLLFPEQCPVIESLMEQVGDSEVLQPSNTSEEGHTPQALSSHSIAKQKIVSFSNEVDQPTDDPPRVSPVAPPRVSRTRQPPRTNASAHSRLETTELSTVELSSPASSLKPPVPARSSLQDHAPVEKAHKWFQLHKAPLVASHRTRRFLPSSHSSRKSLSSEQEFFTPPPTRHTSIRKDKGKVKAIEMNYALPTSAAAGKSAIFQANSDSANPAVPTERLVQVARSAGRINPEAVGESQTLAAANNKPLHVMPGSTGKFSLGALSDLYSQSSTTRSRLDVREATRGSGKREYVDAPPAGTSSLRDLSSSLYSRPKSRVFRNHSKAMDGGADTFNPPSQSLTYRPRRSFSFDNGLDALEAPTEQEYSAVKGAGVWSGGEREQIRHLRTDYAALNKQISDLRGEFRMLKDVLLQAESDRRWRDIECSS
ncbi:hypothetical protein N0V95_002911 [Ascochyta clinopodiicola]|nr:hypothetical protein N0V95_002911 [Ascochyta clinopodiicola]